MYYKVRQLCVLQSALIFITIFKATYFFFCFTYTRLQFIQIEKFNILPNRSVAVAFLLKLWLVNNQETNERKFERKLHQVVKVWICCKTMFNNTSQVKEVKAYLNQR